MRFMKRAAALVLAVLLTLPSVAVMATEEEFREEALEELSEEQKPAAAENQYGTDEIRQATEDHDGGIAPQSLIPLPAKDLEIDLTDLTPVELTMVSIREKLEESGADLSGAAKIAWKPKYSGDDYIVIGIDERIDLSYNTYYSSGYDWEMIVGDGSQLNQENIRYTVNAKTTPSAEWLKPQVYVQDAQGKRTSATIDTCRYADYYSGGGSTSRWLDISIPERERNGKDSYLSLEIDKSQFPNTKISSVKYVVGAYNTAEEALGAQDVTEQVTCSDMASASAGYKIDGYSSELTMIAYDAAGDIIGCLPFTLEFYGSGNPVWVRLYDNNSELGIKRVSGQNEELSFGLEEPYALDGDYTLTLDYDKGTGSEYPAITGVYAGRYESAAQAAAAGAEDIKDSIYGSISGGKGYTADFSKGADFTVVIGEDGNPNQAVYSFSVKTERTVPVNPPEPPKKRGSDLFFSSWLIDEDGNQQNVYIVRDQDDSYAEGNYITMLVPADLDLSKTYAPVFTNSEKAAVHTAGTSEPEKSGESFHRLDVDAPIQYTVTAEDGIAVKNYWLQVKKAAANGRLYINSLADQDANTRTENGIIYSTREVMLDSIHDNQHDICFVNLGTKELPELSAELDSDVVEIDQYWRLNGQEPLPGMSTVEPSTYDQDFEGELPNLAKIRLCTKKNVKDGTEITGTLTVKSGRTTLMVLNLTGIVGDPCITTETIPEAVKYVPYSAVIQNSNKYAWIQPSYEVIRGTLPKGMEMRQNGELYGIPQETGRFGFTVNVSFKSERTGSFPSKKAVFTLTVKENTDDNVYNESDVKDGYSLITPIGVERNPGKYDFYLKSPVESLFVSEGSFDNFIDLWLNGKKLVKDVDYKVESGSTRITVIAQTMQNIANQNGRNTIAAEFRVNGDINDNLKRTAQNFYLGKNEDGGGTGGGGGNGGTGGNGSSNTGGSGTGGNGSSNTGGGSTGGNGNTGGGSAGGNTGSNNAGGGSAGSTGGGSGNGAAATGDPLNFAGWTELMLLSVAVLAGSVFFNKKRNKYL